MTRWRLAMMLGASMLLAAPAWAAPSTVETLDFRLSVDSLSWTSTGFVVRVQVENRTGSPDLFLHHAADQEDPEAFTYEPGETPQEGSPRRTFMLRGLTQARTSATLAFGLATSEEAGLLIVGEARPPHRQVAIALKSLLPERPAPAGGTAVSNAPREAARNSAVPAPNPAPADADVIQQFLPPHPSLGDRILLKEGKPGPQGEGWVRIYTELPDISLGELKRVVETPTQIWRGEAGFLYMRNVSGKRALAVDVRGNRVIAARYVTPEMLPEVVGPRTAYPQRIYMGKP